MIQNVNMYNYSGCEALKIQNAAQVSPSGRGRVNTEVTVTCSVGLSLNSSTVVTCQSDGSWSAVPQCGKYSSEPPPNKI